AVPTLARAIGVSQTRAYRWPLLDPEKQSWPQTIELELKMWAYWGLTGEEDKEEALKKLTPHQSEQKPPSEQDKQQFDEGAVYLQSLTSVVADCRKAHEILQELVSREGEKLGHIDSILQELTGAKETKKNESPILGMAPTLLYEVDPTAKTN